MNLTVKQQIVFLVCVALVGLGWAAHKYLYTPEKEKLEAAKAAFVQSITKWVGNR